MDERKPIFTPEEINVLRGMIDEYLYHQRREQFWRSSAGTFAKVVATIGVFAVIASAIKTLGGF